MVRALIVLLGGCQLVFPIEESLPDACAHEGLELCLTFEDGFGDGLVTDGSPNHLDGTVRGAITRRREITGVADERAIEVVDGTELFQEQINRFDLVAPTSIDLWVNYATLDPQNPLMQSIVFDNDTQYTAAFTSDGFLHCSFGIGPGPIVAHPDTIGPVSPNLWHHVACVTDGVDQTTYVDGQVFNDRGTLPAAGPTYTDGSNLLRFGTQSANPPGRTFFGQLDNVRLWNRALSHDEVMNFASGMEAE